MIFDPNPLFYEMVKLYQLRPDGDKVVIFNEGGSRCFDGNQKVVTEKGESEIKNITTLDRVLTPNGYKHVTEVHKMKNKKTCVRIRLKNGSVIECTEDHLFFFEGVWVSVKHILSLWDGRNMEANSKVQK